MSAIDTMMDHTAAIRRLVLEELATQKHGLSGPVVEQILDAMCRTYAGAVMQERDNEGLEGCSPPVAVRPLSPCSDSLAWDGAHASAEEQEEPEATPTVTVTTLADMGREHDKQVKRGPLSVVCAWKRPGCAGHYSGPKPGPGVDVSHGMCSSCFAIVSHEDSQGRSA